MTNRVIFFDAETFSADLRYSMPPEKFVRLFQWAEGRHGEVHVTTDYSEMLRIVRGADLLIGHNIISYDLPAIFGTDSLEPLHMAWGKKVLDTLPWANLVTPPPRKWTSRAGHTYFINPDKASDIKIARKYLGLDNLAFQLGVEGKLADLRELAKEYAPTEEERAELDARGAEAWEYDPFGRIPLDDPIFVEYAKQDIVTLQQVAVKLLERSDNQIDAYVWREMWNLSIDARISNNGWLVDQQAAKQRVDFLAGRREELLTLLQEQYGFPTEGKSPWATKAGKEATLAILAEHGITPETRDWPTTPKGALKLGGTELIEMTAGTEAEEIGVMLAELKGQRSLAQLALDSMYPDGRVHPDIMNLQRSGRRSYSEPGLSIWGARCPTCGDPVCEHPENRAVEKRYFIADPGHKLLEMDFNAADQRIVAALSGDPAFLDRLSKDGHEITGRMAFGDDVYDSNPRHYRQLAKPLGHGWGYGGGPKTLARVSGLEYEVAKRFCDAMEVTYPGVVRWRSEVAEQGKRGYTTNAWGRRMPVDPDRAFTQSPGLHGQSGTTELLYDGLTRVYQHNPEWLFWLRATIHDAIIICVPEDRVEEARAVWPKLMSTVWEPPYATGQQVEFPVTVGKPADNWYLAGH